MQQETFSGQSKRTKRKKRSGNKRLVLVAVVATAIVALQADHGKAEPVEVPQAVTYQEAVETVDTLVIEVPEEVKTYPVPLDEELQLFIIRECEDYHVDPVIIFSMIEQESSFRAEVIGDHGKSYGLMQIQPIWHSERMNKLGVTDLLNPYQNVTVGIDFLAELLDSGKGTAWALSAYNGGQAYADDLFENGTTSEYAVRVLENSERMKEVMER